MFIQLFELDLVRHISFYIRNYSDLNSTLEEDVQDMRVIDFLEVRRNLFYLFATLVQLNVVKVNLVEILVF